MKISNIRVLFKKVSSLNVELQIQNSLYIRGAFDFT